MQGINEEKYTAEEITRYKAAFDRLRKMICSAAPDAVLFRRALREALAAGFPIDWQEEDGWTLLHYAVNILNAVRAGLPQMLIEAGADSNVQSDGRHTPLGAACRYYIRYGAPECLQTIKILLSSGAQPELDEDWKSFDWTISERWARRDSLDAYIKTCQARSRAEDAAPEFDYAL